MRTYEKCEHCGEETEAEFVDIGIGYEQVTEARCPNNCKTVYEELLEQVKYDLKHNYPKSPSLYVGHTESLLKLVEKQQKEIEYLQGELKKFSY